MQPFHHLVVKLIPNPITNSTVNVHFTYKRKQDERLLQLWQPRSWIGLGGVITIKFHLCGNLLILVTISVN